MARRETEAEMNEVAWVHRLINEIRCENLTPAQLRYLKGIFEMGVYQCEGFLGEGKSVSQDRLLKVDEAARRLGYSRDYLYRHADEFPFTRRQGRNLRFSLVELEDYLRSGNDSSR